MRFSSGSTKGEDLNRRGCSALRVSKASFSSPSDSEEEVLDRIVAAPLSSHFPTVFERFTIQGPNGAHRALVSEVLAPIWDALPFLPAISALDIASTNSQTVSTRKALAHSLIEGVRDLHAKGIVHGDLHFGNVGLSMPALTDGRDKEYIRVCPEVTVVLPRDPAIADFAAHFPPYVAECWSFYNYIQAIGGDQVLPVIKIFDFGSGTLIR